MTAFLPGVSCVKTQANPRRPAANHAVHVTPSRRPMPQHGRAGERRPWQQPIPCTRCTHNDDNYIMLIQMAWTPRREGVRCARATTHRP